MLACRQALETAAGKSWGTFFPSNVLPSRRACGSLTRRQALVTAAAGRPCSAGELARFALNIRLSRRHLFRQLSSDGPAGRALVAARSAALLA